MEIEKVFLIPHFHFDFEWWKEEPHHEQDALIIIEKGLDLLRKFPQFTFVIDTVLPLKYFLEQNPGSAGEIKKYIDEGRLELVGGGVVSPDEGIPTGEGLIRQFSIGKEWYKETFGLDIKVAWEIDEFSHPTQIPQIMQMLGFTHFVFCRGVHPYDALHPTLFRWVSPSPRKKITAYWWAAHYTCAEPTASRKENIKKFFKEMKVRIPFEGERSPVPYLMIPLGGDFSIPTQDWIESVELWNKTESVHMSFSTPSAFFRLVEKETLPEIQEEFAPIYSGYFSSRERLKKRGRELENRLCSTEKLLSLCQVLGAPYPHEEMRQAWWEVLKSDFHDTICGTGTDRVFRKSLERYGRAEKIIDKCAKKNDEFLSRWLSGDCRYVVNPCSWNRREIVEIDGRMEVVTAQPLGISPVRPEATGPSPLTVSPNSMENERIRITVDKKSGALAIYDKEKDREVFSGSGNEIVVEDDIGNLWASRPTGRKHPLKVKEIVVKKGEGYVGEIVVTLSNRLAQVRKSILLPFYGKEVRFAVEIDFFGKDKRIVDTFPFYLGGEWFGEEPFHTSKKESGTWPFQNGVLYRGRNYGVAVINKGIPGHELAGSTLGLVLFRSISMMSFLWIGWLVKNFIPSLPLLMKALKLYLIGFNTYEFPLYPIHHVALRDFASEGSVGAFGALDAKTHLRAKTKFYKESQAWERGPHRFEYAIVLDVEGVDEMTRRGYEFNNPLIIKSLKCTGTGRGAAILTCDTDSVVVSAIHPYNEGLIVRCYDCAGAGGKARFSLDIPIKEVHVVEVINGKSRRLPHPGGVFTHEFSPYEIVSFYLVCR